MIRTVRTLYFKQGSEIVESSRPAKGKGIVIQEEGRKCVILWSWKQLGVFKELRKGQYYLDLVSKDGL